MCLLINQTTNAPIGRDLLKNADSSNPDGMGFAYAVNGEIFIKKFREFKPFYKSYKKAVKRHGKITDFILHFRFSTHGVNNGLFNVHPFKINESLAFAHNGMLDVDDHKKKSDTQIFNETILQKLKPNFLNNTAVCQLLEGFIGSDKLVFLNSDGKSTILNEKRGHWDGGTWFSNDSYKTRTTSIACGWGSDYYTGYSKPVTINSTCSACSKWDMVTQKRYHGQKVYLCETCKPYYNK